MFYRIWDILFLKLLLKNSFPTLIKSIIVVDFMNLCKCFCSILWEDCTFPLSDAIGGPGGCLSQYNVLSHHRRYPQAEAIKASGMCLAVIPALRKLR